MIFNSLVIQTMNFYAFTLLIFCVSLPSSLCLTETQMKSTVKLMRNTCQPKSKVTDEQIDGMHSGKWDFEKNAMCYIHCWMKMMKVINPDGKIDLESAKKQLATMPPARQAPALVSFDKCGPLIDAMGLKDKCEVAYNFAKCFYDDNPENYFLP